MPPPIELAKNIRCKMLGLYGRDDHVIGPDEVARLSGDSIGMVSVTIFIFTMERLRADGDLRSDDAWDRVIESLDGTLSRTDAVARAEEQRTMR